MLEKIRHQQILRMNAKVRAGARWDHAYRSRIMRIIEEAKAKARYLKADYIGHEKFEVNNWDGMRWSVDLIKQDSVCRKWQSTEIPCSHTIAGMLSRNICIHDYVDLCYQKASYLRLHSPIIHPFPALELWPDLGKNPLNLPAK